MIVSFQIFKLEGEFYNTGFELRIQLCKNEYVCRKWIGATTSFKGTIAK